MADLHDAIQQIRDELRSAFKKADGNAAEQAKIHSYLEKLTFLQEQLTLDQLMQHAVVLNGLSDLLEVAIADIRTNINSFLLTDLEAIKARVDAGAGRQPTPVPTAPQPTPALKTPAQPTLVAIPVAPAVDYAALKIPHRRFPGSVSWSLTRSGLGIGGAPPDTTDGPPDTVRKVWALFGPAITLNSQAYGVPAELIVATICTESGGDEHALRLEPGYISDEATPRKVSPGLMQTLIATARDALHDPVIDRNWLLVGANSIKAGTAYIRDQANRTGYDPPVVACAYNAGSVVFNDGAANRWKMRQFPIGTSQHADRFVRWLNDAFRYFATLNPVPPVSYVNLIPP